MDGWLVAGVACAAFDKVGVSCCCLPSGGLLAAAGAAGASINADEDLYMQLVQMQQLSNTLVQDMRQ